MAMKLVDSFTTTSEVSSVILGAGSSGSSGNYTISDNNPHMVVFSDMTPATDNKLVYVRLTVGGTPQTGSTDYAYAGKQIRAASSNSQIYDSGDPQLRIGGSTGTGTEESIQGMMMLYNFYNSNALASVTYQTAFRAADGNLYGDHGGGQMQIGGSGGVADGIQFFFQSSVNIVAGARFNLYKFD